MKINISILFLLFGSALSFGQVKQLTLKDAVSQQYRTYGPERITAFQWLPKSNSYSFLSKDMKSLYKSSVSASTTNIPPDVWMTLSEVNQILSSNLTSLASLEFIDDTHCFLNDGQKYYLLDLKSKTGAEMIRADEGADNVMFHAATKKLAYTIENNLYLKEMGGASIAITNNQDKNIVSGQSIARNEFGISGGIFWSHNGNVLAFYQKDESKVHDYPLLNINDTPGTLTSIKYPMTGQASEQPKVGIYNCLNKSTVYISPTGSVDDYLTNVCFTPDDQYIIIAEVNRAQNHMHLNLYDAQSGKFIKTLFEEQSTSWTEPEHPAFFPSQTSNNFIWISERDGYNNLYYYDLNGKLIKQLTNNKFVIKNIIGASVDGNCIYYSATGENPLNTLAYSYEMKAGKTTLLTKEEGTHSVAVSTDGKYVYDAFSSGSIPHKALISTINGKMAKLLVALPDKLNDVQIGKAQLGVLSAKDGSTLHYRMIQPSNFDSTKKYPVLVYVYGGPHAQMITNSWLYGANLWMYWMAEQGYIIYTLDNRGSSERGLAFESQIHRQLGEVEMQDQMTGVSFLKSLPYIDSNRLAVHGWSYGGFMTTSLMLRQPGTFKVGVAGGPVTDWKYYETMYGERYMDQPDENKEGYAKASLLNYAGNLKGDLLLIHGTIDDVVVMQHNYALVKKFVDLGIQMDFFPYPMHKHNVTGKDRVHLMEKVLNYVIDNNK